MPDLSPRGRVIRDAVIYTPLFAACLALLLLMVVGVFDRASLGIILLGIVSFLFGYQSIQALRDLAAKPREFSGPVARRWTKRDGLVVKTHYVTVGKAIFRIPVESYLDLKVRDVVRVVAYPYTGTVVSVERLSRPAAEEPLPGAGPVKGRLRTLRTARATPAARARREGAEAESEAGLPAPHDQEDRPARAEGSGEP